MHSEARPVATADRSWADPLGVRARIDFVHDLPRVTRLEYCRCSLDRDIRKYAGYLVDRASAAQGWRYAWPRRYAIALRMIAGGLRSANIRNKDPATVEHPSFLWLALHLARAVALDRSMHCCALRAEPGEASAGHASTKLPHGAHHERPLTRSGPFGLHAQTTACAHLAGGFQHIARLATLLLSEQRPTLGPPGHHTHLYRATRACRHLPAMRRMRLK